MLAPANGAYLINVERVPGLGSPWIVRTYKKRLLFKKLVSSDWFLDEDQARRFAEELAREIDAHGSPSTLARRKPGWTLHQPAH